MSPVRILQGTRELDAVSERNLAERRLFALATAVRHHEAAVRRAGGLVRPQDARLYRRLRQITAARGLPGREAA